MKKLKEYFKKYKVLNKRIEELTTTKNNIKSICFSLLITVLVLLIPILILSSLTLFANTGILIGIAMLLSLIGGIFFYNFIYYKLIISYNEEIKDVNTNIPFLVESGFLSSLIVFLGTIVLFVLFI